MDACSRPAAQATHLNRCRSKVPSVRSDGESSNGEGTLPASDGHPSKYPHRLGRHAGPSSRKKRGSRSNKWSESTPNEPNPPTDLSKAPAAPEEPLVELANAVADAVDAVLPPTESGPATPEPDATAKTSTATPVPTPAPTPAATSASSTPTLPPLPPPPPAQEAASEQVLESLKLQLLAAVSSLDRGIAANVREAKEVDELAAALEAAGGSVVLQWKTLEARPDESTMEQLGGTWRLIYSSGFNSGSLGGRRPGPPAALFPVVLGQVYQRIDNNQGKLDNIVEFLFSYPLPPLPFLNTQPESPAVRLTLGHDFKVLNINTVEITYEDTAVQFQGTELLDSFPRLAAPTLPESLRPPRFLRSATFDVTYLDGTMRVTRGDRGELRVYLRDTDLMDAAPTFVPTESTDLD